MKAIAQVPNADVRDEAQDENFMRDALKVATETGPPVPSTSAGELQKGFSLDTSIRAPGTCRNSWEA
jgi:hypothetical protein